MRIGKHTESSRVGVLYVPKRIASLVPRDAHFKPELTDEGILYRFVGFTEPDDQASEPPAWAKNGTSDE